MLKLSGEPGGDNLAGGCKADPEDAAAVPSGVMVGEVLASSPDPIMSQLSTRLPPPVVPVDAVGVMEQRRAASRSCRREAINPEAESSLF